MHFFVKLHGIGSFETLQLKVAYLYFTGEKGLISSASLIFLELPIINVGELPFSINFLFLAHKHAKGYPFFGCC
jgi:hypothetical protein